MSISAEKYSTGEMLPIMEHFYTIQGEGNFAGQPAYFVRLAGCDVGCVWCDVKESWDPKQHPDMAVVDIIKLIKKTPAKIVVITGGEPAIYPLQFLTKSIQDAGLRTHVETSGAYKLTGTWDWVCLSPKKFKPTRTSVYKQADELKVIIYNKHDFLWAEKHLALLAKNCMLYLQPEWGRKEKMMGSIVDYVKEHPSWFISIQTHKYLNIP
jgi:7-carboxy-7-deazaguanine synthase